MKIIEKIKAAFKEDTLSSIGKFIIGWIIVFDTIGGTCIPLAYRNGCGWFAIPNLLIDICVICWFVKMIKDENTH